MYLNSAVQTGLLATQVFLEVDLTLEMPQCPSASSICTLCHTSPASAHEGLGHNSEAMDRAWNGLLRLADTCDDLLGRTVQLVQQICGHNCLGGRRY